MRKHWDDYGDILTVKDLEELLGIGTKSARKLMREHGVLVAGKWLMGKQKLKEMFA